MLSYANTELIQPKISIIGMKVINVGLNDCLLCCMVISICLFCSSISLFGSVLACFVCFCSSFVSSLNLFMRFWSVMYLVRMVINRETKREISVIDSTGGNCKRGKNKILSMSYKPI